MGIGKSDLYLVVVIYHHADRFSIYNLIFSLFSREGGNDLEIRRQHVPGWG